MHKLFKQSLPILALSSLCLLAAACTHNPYATKAKPMFKQTNKAFQYLNHEGIKVVDLGQTIRLTFPSKRFFLGTSTTLNPNKTVVLQQVAALASSYPQAKISIIGYSDNVLSNREAKANSLAQAQAIAGFLWNDGLPSTRVHVMGKGYVAPLNSMGTPRAGAMNRRVEMFISPTN